MAGNAIKSEFRTSKRVDLFEIARNAMESNFRTSKMAAEKHNSVIKIVTILVERSTYD